MASTTVVDQQLMRELRFEITEAVKVIGDMHGVTLSLGRGKFSYSEGTFPLQITPKDGSGQAVDPRALAFKQNAYEYGLSPADLGRLFVSAGKVYTIIGANPKAHKYPILAKCKNDGKTYRLPVSHVVQQLLPRVTDPKAAAEALAKRMEFDPNAPF